MKRSLTLLVLALGFAAGSWGDDDYWDYAEGDATEYTNEWVAEIHGGEHVAKRVARDHGFRYDGPAEPFENHYLFTREDHPELSFTHRKDLTRRMLAEEDEVKWAEQQQIMKYELK